jgi:uncharacterized protein (DUF885 family)
MTEHAASVAVDDLADRFWQGLLERQPLAATFFGDDRFDDRLDDPGPAGRAADLAAAQALLAEAAAIERPGLAVEAAITLDMLEVVGRLAVRAHEQASWQLTSIDQMGGPQALTGDLARVQRLDVPHGLDRLLARLAAYPAYIDGHIDVLRAGVAAGRTAAAPVVERVLEQTVRAVTVPAAEDPLLAAHPELDAASRARLDRAIAHDVRPAQQRFLEAVRDYAPHARREPGLWALPDGEALYEAAIEGHTTLVELPAAIHAYGRARLEVLDGQRLAIARHAGEASVEAYRATLLADPGNHAGSGDEIVALCEAVIERATAAAPRVFGRLPRAACVVRPVEPYAAPEAPPAFYLPPRPDGARPGTFFVNTYQPTARPLHRFAATAFHEAVPGHHFQLAIETELTGLPAFRTLGSRLAGVAYTEGWGLYSEGLADELGLYLDDRERFGMLEAQAWRAARLIVDTGLHAFRWDRERAVQFLEGAAGLPRLEAETETDRYIAGPGQALAYMIGQRELQALRSELTERAGSAFDLTAFHDAVLGHGALPLATLRRQLPRWLGLAASNGTMTP